MGGHARLTAIATVALACSERPSDGELARWRDEARAANEARLAVAQGDERSGWTLTVSGRIAGGRRARFAFRELDDLARTHVRTRSPHNPAAADAVIDFRGVPVATLLDRAGADPGVDDITAVAYDGFRATIRQADARRYPVLLALEADGRPIPRSAGGPLFQIFPWTDHPELERTYPDRFWAFYVTDLIVGTEPIAISVGGRTLGPAELATLAPVSFTALHGYKVEWPSGEITFTGVHVRDVLALAGVELPAAGSVAVRGKAPIHRDPVRPPRVDVAELRGCDVILATALGPERRPIPARLGGPVTLAFGPTCPGRDTAPWVTFVEELVVERAEEAP